MIRKKLVDTSSELEIYPVMNGIQLQLPKKINCDLSNNIPTIKELLQLPGSIYLLNRRSELQNANDFIPQVLEVSLTKLLGKSIMETMPANNHREILHDQIVLESGRQSFFRESVQQSNGEVTNFLTIKFPWYTANNEIIGLLGCSVVIDDSDALVDVLNLLRNWQLLTASKPTTSDRFYNLKIAYAEISKREIIVIEQLMLGKSARDIGEALNISKRTVETHIENIKNKVGVNKKSELIEKIIAHINPSHSY